MMNFFDIQSTVLAEVGNTCPVLVLPSCPGFFGQDRTSIFDLSDRTGQTFKYFCPIRADNIETCPGFCPVEIRYFLSLYFRKILVNLNSQNCRLFLVP
jgi:hypothetical protein